MIKFKTNNIMFIVQLEKHLQEHPEQANAVSVERGSNRWTVTFADREAMGPVLAMLSLYVGRRERGVLVGPEGLRVHDLKRTGRSLERLAQGVKRGERFCSRWFQ